MEIHNGVHPYWQLDRWCFQQGIGCSNQFQISMAVVILLGRNYLELLKVHGHSTSPGMEIYLGLVKWNSQLIPAILGSLL